MTKVIARKINEVYTKIECEQSIARELSEHFRFQVPGYQFTPKFKNGWWDGYIYLFSVKAQTIYTGLLHYVEEFCKNNDYQFWSDQSQEIKHFYTTTDAHYMIQGMGIPEKYLPRDYQYDTFVECLNNQRSLFVSPTGSGKSLIIYWLFRYYEYMTKKPVLLIVPNVSLVNQMYGDFKAYGYDEKKIHRIYSGQEKDVDAPIIISTWQSIYKLPKTWFDKFSCVIGDEAHKAKAANLKDILEKMTDTRFRFGMTGSLDGTKTNKMVLEGLFGKYQKIVSTSELINQGVLADLKIKVCLLKHDAETCKSVKQVNEYHNELATLVASKKRNDFISKLALGLDGNVLILYQLVEDHGVLLYDSIKSMTNDIDVYLVHGKIKPDEREQIRLQVNNKKRSITVASMGCFAEGINIPNLNYMILASPTKSRIRVMQMIGRVLRKTDRKNHSVVFDIADDLSVKNYRNFTLKHYVERLKYYNEENFDYQQYKVDL